ncbi:hypothetical protein [Paenibacillus thermotolerans]|uniref:hypothetical protein n=1 Tax=Paenibacillus thermotolerans TaxID=3027807 RepID=UPI0023674B08|nr:MULTISPECIES: hypothetical protein [unclassified Paenibacillus]
MITDILSGYDHQRASNDLQNALLKEIDELTTLVLETARSNVRYYPDVRSKLQKELFFVANQMISGEVKTDYWEAFLEQFGKGSLMAGENENPGLRAYINSDIWNRLRSKNIRAVVGRARGSYKSIDGTVRYSGGSRRGVNLEFLAQKGIIDQKFLPTPQTYFLRIALKSNRRRILQGLQRVIETFPYQNYFLKG